MRRGQAQQSFLNNHVCSEQENVSKEPVNDSSFLEKKEKCYYLFIDLFDL